MIKMAAKKNSFISVALKFLYTCCGLALLCFGICYAYLRYLGSRNELQGILLTIYYVLPLAIAALFVAYFIFAWIGRVLKKNKSKSI